MQKTETELGDADDKPTTPGAVHAVKFTATLSTMPIEYFDDGARDDFAVGVATGIGVPRGSVRVAVGTRVSSVILETSITVDGDVDEAAALASSLTDQAKPLVDEFRFGPSAVSCVRVEEPAAAAAPAEEAPVGAPSEPVPPPAPAMTEYIPLQTIRLVFHDNGDNRQPDEEIEGRAGGGLWDYAVADNDGELGGEEDAVRQGSCVAPWDSGGVSAAAAAAAVGLQTVMHGRIVDEDLHAERSVYTSVLKHREESPSPPAPDDASATWHTRTTISPSRHHRRISGA